VSALNSVLSAALLISSDQRWAEKKHRDGHSQSKFLHLTLMITARLKARKNGDVVTVLRFQILLHLQITKQCGGSEYDNLVMWK
jgi:hypothetical protein